MYRTRSPHYMEKPRSKRLDKYVSLRTEINADRNGAGVFRAYHLLRGMKNSENVLLDTDEETESFECSFLSHTFASAGIIYHADIRTVDSEVRHFLREQVRQNVMRRLSDVGLKYRDAHGEVDFSGNIIVFHPDPPLPQFGGETVKTLYQEEWAACKPSDYHHITEGFALNPKRSWGVDLTAIVPYTGLTLPNVLDTIERFRQLEEQPCNFPINWDDFDGEIEKYIAQASERGRPY